MPGKIAVVFHTQPESCAVLLSRDDPLLRCIACSEYCKSLRAQQERTANGVDRTDPSLHVNNRYLTSQEKGMRLKKLHDSTRSLAKGQSHASIERDGTALDDNMYGDIHTIMSEESATILSKYSEGLFQHRFWEQQVKAASCKNAKCIRWHPLFIRWCLFLRH